MTQARRLFLDLTFIGTLLFVAFSLYLDEIPLHMPDEARYSLVSLEMFKDHQYLIPKILGIPFLDKPPFFYYAQVLSLKLFGISEYALRLPSIIASVSCCLMIFFTCSKLYCRKMAWSATLILANIPLYFVMSHYANLDMMVASLITIALCFFILAQNVDSFYRRKLMWGCYLFISLAMLTKGLIALAFPCCIVFLYALFHRLRPKLYLLDGFVIFLIIVSPWFLLMHFEIPGFSYYYFIVQHFYRYLSSSFNNQEAFWFYFVIVFGCSLPWIFFCRSTSLTSNKLNNRFFFTAFVFILCFFSIPSSKPLGYIVPCLPMLAILLAINLEELDCSKKNKLYLLLSGIGLLFSLVALYPWQFTKAYRLDIMPYAVALAIACCLNFLIALSLSSLQYKREIEIKKSNYFFIITTLTLFFLNINALTLIKYLCQQKSVQPIAQFLAQHNRKHYPVAMYLDYYFDLPFYAPKQNIIAVNYWKKGIYKGDTMPEQFALGMAYQSSKHYMLTKDFIERWQGPNHMYAIASESNAEKLLQYGGKQVYKTNDIYLLGNH